MATMVRCGNAKRISEWRIAFDDGIRPEPADAAAAQAFRERSKVCLS